MRGRQWYPVPTLLDNCGVFWGRFSSPIPWIEGRRSIGWYLVSTAQVGSCCRQSVKWFIHFLTMLFDQNTGHHNPNDAEDYKEDRYHSDHDVDPHSGSTGGIN